MADKDHILGEIRRVAIKIGRSPGIAVFEAETGIVRSEWHGKLWRAWGDALQEAGLQENGLNAKLPVDSVLQQFAVAVRHFGRIPAMVDLRMFARQNEGFPSHNVFTNHFPGKASLVVAFSEWVRRNEEYHDLLDLLPDSPEPNKAPSGDIREGSVYLLRSGDHYKIGRSDQLELRVKQITVSLPEKVTLEHTIRTDDPPGIESYWHRRFSEKRANGEWFRLSAADVRAFKRRKFQ
ncbi:GIY-YIG nuclease family protein [Tabrizicola sp.]|uniref:GIY-YIG nuclease family protein n=1 Tax=Tabrizicola sp. TaxID=2005166 RepID=UPI00286A9844|nr:GIY-YIG nuclease family protein [Tabrizicola sp.]